MSFRTELKVPPEAAFGSLVDGFAADAATRSGLNDAQRDAFVIAAGLGYAAIVEEAMAEAREPLRIVATCTPHALTLSLFERGLPMVDSQARREPRWSEITSKVDEAHWHSHGNAGSELRLRVERPHGLPMHEAPPQAGDEEAPLAPEQPYTIRRFERGDAPGIVRAFYLTYGYHYDIAAVYVPSRLIELNEAGHYISIVAVAQDGEIAGHYALQREGDDPIAEGGGAIVNPSHRGRDLMNRMRRFAEQEAERMGLAAYYTEPVTDHGRTQHASQTFGAKACGLTLGEAPANFLAKHLELSATAQRQSFMLYFKPLRARETRTVYAPARHRAMIEKIYAQLGLPVTLAQGSPPSEHGVLRTTIVRADEIGRITVDLAGAGCADLVRQAVNDLRGLRHLGGLYVRLPLDDPGTPELCDAIEGLGFFFGGVGPWMLDGRDMLRMQMPLTPLDFSALTVVGEFGNELAAYVEAERDRVAIASTASTTRATS